MFFTYLRRELLNRRKQTIVVSLGLAIGIALVTTVSAVSTGVKQSQTEVLNSLYGVGTDITITQQAAPGAQGGRFDIGARDGNTSGQQRSFSSTRLEAARGAVTFTDETVYQVSTVRGVAAVATALKLTNTTFNGTLPDFMQRGPNTNTESRAPLVPGGDNSVNSPSGSINSTIPVMTTTTTQAPTGGADGQGGSSFSITSFSVLGIGTSTSEVGPMSSVQLANGRLLTSNDSGEFNAVLDSTYAQTEELELGSTITVGDQEFNVVGLVAPVSGSSTTPSNVYIPIDDARVIAGIESGVTNIYVKVTSGDEVKAASSSIAEVLPDATISTSEDLAEAVSGSLSTASDLMSNFGRWLSVIVLIVAFVLAILFTIGGVTRRTREFGTLKALGWRSNKIVRQVMAESVVQGLIGGVIGAAVGYGATFVVNAVAPTLQATTGNIPFGEGGGQGRLAQRFGGQVPPGGAARFGQSIVEVVLRSSITPGILLTAIGLAVLGGLLAGAAGGMRAARLRPAESLRSVG